jgi:hypothetical protein
MFRVNKESRLTGKRKPQCCVLDDYGRQCPNKGYRVEMYFGNPELGVGHPDNPDWVLVPMCKKHSDAAP